jgi:hypothetical protein
MGDSEGDRIFVEIGPFTISNRFSLLVVVDPRASMVFLFDESWGKAPNLLVA